MPAAVDAKEQVERTLGAQRAVRRVQTLVAVLGAAPDVVLDGTVDVVLRVALDDEHAAGFQVPVEVFGIVVVERPELLQHRVHLAGGRGAAEGHA